jgi:hypothetical protein
MEKLLEALLKRLPLERAQELLRRRVQEASKANGEDAGKNG